ncbi:GNAT family N-acetyltransferase [Herbaspirillum sp. WKF16]|jgi:DNA-binding MarR family transcriptional regulator/GNAT superfamily N-acetyltransferase|uniref:bifunctional helix-turn-helix transcriptional regulator/GNAT family N-acetyltransferase n=1 Tax=Herbaspirillum sp. WKF16 TaxID=3028312 RepID=UPI0023A9858E|nr:GNAT family N-acetyltransferase [Herbaspirillum sp. WKF16]WDZ96157.1 GNAT family N-acetyltransferase [Herbaspirillum sp. WKF16]
MDFAGLDAAPREQTIRQLRELSRKLVRELGFMRSTLAGSELAPSAVHAIIEIGQAPGIQARDLGELLCLDKSNTSRQAARLESLGLLRRAAVDGDGRGWGLFLTEAGQALRRKIDKFATDQVSAALTRLVPEDQQGLVRALALYSDALARDNPNMAPRPAAGAEAGALRQGYLPGCIGDIAGLHARYYAATAGFGAYFEDKVAGGLGAFVQALPAAGKEIWMHVEQGRALASIAIDGDLERGVAHLRWFIVDDSLRGGGVGRALLQRAMDFVDGHGFETYLWTFQGLQAARHLYESAGFTLAEEAPGEQWGARVVEQRFVRAARQR